VLQADDQMATARRSILRSPASATSPYSTWVRLVAPLGGRLRRRSMFLHWSLLTPDGSRLDLRVRHDNATQTCPDPSPRCPCIAIGGNP
jgi:hypothetical protein